MRIAIDIDGVILDPKAKLNFWLYDRLFFGHPKITNKILNFKPTKPIINRCSLRMLNPILKEAAFIEGAINTINYLQKQGHTIILLSTRGNDKIAGAEESHKIAIKQLKNAGLNFDEDLCGAIDKAQVCKDNKIDLLIESSFTVCQTVAKEGIQTIHFSDKPRKSSLIDPATSWKDVKNILSEKIKVQTSSEK